MDVSKLEQMQERNEESMKKAKQSHMEISTYLPTYIIHTHT